MLTIMGAVWGILKKYLHNSLKDSIFISKKILILFLKYFLHVFVPLKTGQRSYMFTLIDWNNLNQFLELSKFKTNLVFCDLFLF